MTKWMILLIVLSQFGVTYSQQEASGKDLVNGINEKVPLLMKEKKVPGMAIAILENGQLIYVQGYGLSNIKENKIVTPETGFNIGSISKLFTAVGVMKLVENGIIDLDVPVENYLTRWKLPNSVYDKNKVTVRHLLNHTAGISVHGYPGFINKNSLPSLESSLNGNNGPARADEKVAISIEPQTEFNYSGGGYTILQLVIEEVTNMPFGKYMDKTIFKPLKMKNSSFKIDKKIIRKSAIPYDKNMEELPLEYFTAQAAAGMHTTLNDLILFTDDILNSNTLISKKIIDEMTVPTKVSKKMYGLGFRVMRFGPILLKGHAGSNTGWQSALFIDFKTKSGLIMLTNGDAGDSVLKSTLRTWSSIKYRK